MNTRINDKITSIPITNCLIMPPTDVATELHIHQIRN